MSSQPLANMYPTQQVAFSLPLSSTYASPPNYISFAHPPPQPPQAKVDKQERSPSITHRHWNTNLCDCCLDTSSCCFAFVCPCVAFGKIVNHVGDSGCGRGCCCLICPCSIFIRAPYRKKLRIKYNLPAKPCNDCCTSFWCPCCALAQELREIKTHAPGVQSMD